MQLMLFLKTVIIVKIIVETALTLIYAHYALQDIFYSIIIAYNHVLLVLISVISNVLIAARNVQLVIRLNV